MNLGEQLRRAGKDPAATATVNLLRGLVGEGQARTVAGIFVAAFGVYLATAPRSVAGADSAELSTAAYTLGIPHPPGYPLYVLIGRLFASIPIGEVAFRLNLMSAVLGALAAVAVYAIVFELTRHRLSAVVAALALAFSHHFWGQSLVAEVYTLDAALLGGIIYALCRWERTHHNAALYAAFFLFGLGLAHRTTTVLLVIPLAMWAIRSGSLRSPGAYVRAFACTIPGLLLYLLLPIMYLAVPSYMWNKGYDLAGNPLFADLSTWEGMKWYLTGKIFEPLAFAYDAAGLWGETTRYAGWLWEEFTGVGIALGLIGLASAWFRHRAFFVLTAATFAVEAWFYISYAAIDKDQMFLPTYLVWALWIGLGAKALLDLVDTGHVRTIAAPAARALVLGLPAVLLLLNLPLLDFSGENPTRDRAESLLEAAPEGALVIGEWGETAPLDYFQTVEKQRPDLTVVTQWSFSSQYFRKLIETNIDRRPIYLLRNAPQIQADYRLVKDGPWFRVERQTPKEGG